MTNGGNIIAEFRDPNGTQGIGIGYNRIYGTGSNPNQDIAIEPRGSGIVSGTSSSNGSDHWDALVTVGRMFGDAMDPWSKK